MERKIFSSLNRPDGLVAGGKGFFISNKKFLQRG
jgi:hypothetical protein